mgnify:CR=1 FL=1
MKPLGKTIQIYCPNGEPRGVRIAEITTRIVQAVVGPNLSNSAVDGCGWLTAPSRSVPLKDTNQCPHRSRGGVARSAIEP